MKPKIVTVTANTAIDYVLEVNQLTLGDNSRAKNSVKFAAGKGLNVAKAIACLTYPVQVLGFVGIKSDAVFQELSSALITTDYTRMAGETRTNLTLSDSEKNQETHIRTAGFSVTTADCQNLMAKLTSIIHKNDIVVLSGSLPDHAPADFYADLINCCHAKSAFVFLDSSGQSLAAGVTAKPYLIKPNQAEFEALVGRSLQNAAEMLAAARQIIATGVKWVVISRAEQGALMVGETQALAALVVNAQAGKIISHVGCGDALVAGLAVAKRQELELVEMLKLAVACVERLTYFRQSLASLSSKDWCR